MRMLVTWSLGRREACEAIRSGRMADTNKPLES